jgi:hypothetical protein
MLNAVTTKLEIDIMQANELDQAIQLAVAHKLPAIVVHQQLVTSAMASRIRRNGQFKIIVVVDWPKGDTYGIGKLRGLNREMMEVDGYEILLTGGKTEIETKNEAKLITEFIRTYINSSVEIRFVLGCYIRTEDEVIASARIMKDIKAPKYIRTDTHLRMQITKANLKTHTALVESIRRVCASPLKLSGNIDSIRTIAGCLQLPQAPARFAVSLQQLQQIIKDLQKQPDELRMLLQPGQAVLASAEVQ